MMSDICNSILGQVKIGLELRKYWFSSSSKIRLLLQWRVLPLSFVFAKYQTSQYPRIYNYVASCCQTPNFPIPFDLLLQVTPGHAQLAHHIHTALSDFERRLPLVDFQSHKLYSKGLPRSLEWKFVYFRTDYNYKAVRACERSSIPHHASAFCSWVVWENQRHLVTAQ